MQEIDAIQNKRESKIISSINNDTTENGHIVFDYREKSGYRNFDTHRTGTEHQYGTGLQAVARWLLERVLKLSY